MTITLKVADLEQENISVKKGSEITFQDKIYQQGGVVSKRQQEKTPPIVEEYKSSDLEIILVEHKVFFSIWIGKTKEDTTETVANQQSVKKIIKHYRGVSYEVEIPDYNAQTTSASVETRKYRGQSY